MRVCIINSTTKICENIVILDSAEEFLPYKDNIEVAPDHNGEIGWTWSYEEGWVDPTPPITLEQKAARIRRARNAKLKKHVDRINPVRWESMSEEEKDQWTTYRQALLDVTDQVTFPESVVWPLSYDLWLTREKTEEELVEEEFTKQYYLQKEITKHRDMLISNGFWFNGIKFDSRPEDQKRISGASLLAFMAISQGAQPNNFYWHGGDTPFTWIAQNNNSIEMDAYTVIEFGKAAAEHERSYVFAARALKDMMPIPEDYTNPIYWPNNNQDGSSII